MISQVLIMQSSVVEFVLSKENHKLTVEFTADRLGNEQISSILT